MIFIRSLVAAALLPGTVTVIVPWLILRRWPSHTHHGTGFVLIAAGAAILFRCVWEFAVMGQGTLAPVDPPKHLVVSGLYHYVRNPMYVGIVLILGGEAWTFASWTLALYAAGFFAAVNLFIMFYEEPVLRRKFGVSYTAYLREVPRWVPRIRRRG